MARRPHLTVANPENRKPISLPSDSDPDLVREFVSQVAEFAQAAEQSLLALEARPDDEGSIHACLRALHTIKGTAGCFGFEAVSELVHRLESVLSRFRSKEARCTPALTSLALRAVDAIKSFLAGLNEALSGRPAFMPPAWDEVLDALAATRESPARQSTRPVELAAAAECLREPRVTAAGSERGAVTSLRVRTERLDKLIDMVGELVIAQSMVAQDAEVAHSARHDLLRKVTRVGKIVREIQDLSMTLRMVPLRGVFQKLPRIVRDVAQRSGKKVRFLAEGEDTEIDRNMAEAIQDPLVHMVRNAVDHGIELPEEREACGKPRLGTVHLSAHNAGGSVVIEVRDDGKGLDRERILQKGVSLGLLDSDRSASDAEVHELIFAPGFSTAVEVTDISGRGVGMDVVKRNIESLRGRVEISSVFRQGCTFRIGLPLTLAVTDGMLISVGAERFIIPTANIHMSFRPEASEVSTIANQGELVSLREELVPIVRLHRMFRIKGAIEDLRAGLLLVVNEGGRRYAFLVDALLGQQQVVAKSLGSGLTGVRGFCGGAILGDGRVGLILDTAEIVSLARQSQVELDKAK